MAMLEQVLKHLHNWFLVTNGIHPGTYTIEDGVITLPFLRDGQFFRICGSVFSDGLHRYGPAMELLRDETFDGAVWALAVPEDVVELSKEIGKWRKKYGGIAESPYQSESFGGYSYTMKSGGGNDSANSWQSVFRARLNPYRKLREI